MLMTAPLLDWQVVLCKYLGCLAFYVVLWLPTLCYLPALLGWHAFELHAPSGLASFVFILGLIIFLTGIVLQFPINLEPFWRLSGLLMIVSGLVIGILGGMNHFQSEGPHLIDFQSEIDPFPVLSTYLGMFLAGAMFLSIGILVSSLVKDQMVSALIAMGLSLLFLVAGFWRPEQDGGLFYRTLYFFSVPLHFERSFTRGIFDTRPIILYVSTAFFCLFLTVRSLESRRWR
jgi:ABC-type transport system involved in multi-copper enzyme maturation permease subunit